jgi:hypothetical protein
MPCQCSTSIAEQSEVDLGPHIQCHDIKKFRPSAIGYTLHFFMISWPLLFDLLLKFRSVLKNFWPSLFAVLEKKASVELDAATNLEPCGLAVLETDLGEELAAFACSRL